jgi:hypothetical protein
MKKFAAFVFLGLWSLSSSAQIQFCAAPLTESLVAHGSIPAGTVTVGNDKVNLYVVFGTSTTDFTISRADVAVATSLAGIPQSGGQPNLSAFAYRQTFSPEVTTTTFTIPLASIPASSGTTLVIAAHAALDSPTQGHQQAWANPGQLFPCSQACSSSSCGGDDHGDKAHLRSGDGNGGGDEGGGGDDDCHGEGGDRAHSWTIAGGGVRLFDDGHGGTGQCGGSGGGDDHGDSQKVSPLWGDGGGGDQSCGGSGDHHGDHAHASSSPQGGDGGGDGGGDHHHSDGGSDCQAGCGATYFGFTVAKCFIE